MADLGGDRVHVAVTLRPLAKILPSMWQQNVKVGIRMPFDAWVRQQFPEPGAPAPQGFWRIHRHDALVARWAAIVGPDRLTVVVPDEADRSDVFRAFERLLGLVPGTLAGRSDHANRSLTVEEAETVRAFNRAFHDTGLPRPLHARVMRYGAAEYVSRLGPVPGDGPIRLPAWALEPVAGVAPGDGGRDPGLRGARGGRPRVAGARAGRWAGRHAARGGAGDRAGAAGGGGRRRERARAERRRRRAGSGRRAGVDGARRGRHAAGPARPGDARPDGDHAAPPATGRAEWQRGAGGR